MNADHVSLLLAVLGGTFLFASLVGRRAGDAPSDVWLMLATAGCMLTASFGMQAVR
jgi:hypothetical protein